MSPGTRSRSTRNRNTPGTKENTKPSSTKKTTSKKKSTKLSLESPTASDDDQSSDETLDFDYTTQIQRVNQQEQDRDNDSSSSDDDDEEENSGDEDNLIDPPPRRQDRSPRNRQPESVQVRALTEKHQAQVKMGSTTVSKLKKDVRDLQGQVKKLSEDNETLQCRLESVNVSYKDLKKKYENACRRATGKKRKKDPNRNRDMGKIVQSIAKKELWRTVKFLSGDAQLFEVTEKVLDKYGPNQLHLTLPRMRTTTHRLRWLVRNGSASTPLTFVKVSTSKEATSSLSNGT